MEKESQSQKNNQYPHYGENVSLLPILAVNFISTLGFSIVLPFLVFLVNRLGGNAFIYGLTSSIYPAFQLIGAPILGRWSDTYGRKKNPAFKPVGSATFMDYLSGGSLFSGRKPL